MPRSRCVGAQKSPRAGQREASPPASLEWSNPDRAKRARSTTAHCRITALPDGERPVIKLWNESRTNRARIADSLAVGIRSRRHLVAASVPTTKSGKRRQSGTARPGEHPLTAAPPGTSGRGSGWAALGCRHCVLAVARLGCGVETNSVACKTPRPIGVGTATRKGTITRVPVMGASQSSMSRSCARYLIA
jgi:hypothetical protein